MLAEQNLPIGRLLKFATKCSQPVADAYAAPFPGTYTCMHACTHARMFPTDSTYKAGAAKWPLLVPLWRGMPVAVDTSAAVEFFEKNGSKYGVLVMFSDNDPVTSGAKPQMLHLFPDAAVVDVHGGWHFLQEEHGELLASNLIKHVKL